MRLEYNPRNFLRLLPTSLLREYFDRFRIIPNHSGRAIRIERLLQRGQKTHI